MLKTNSKQARENIRAYIVDNFDCSNYEPEKEPETFLEISAFILSAFRREKYYSDSYERAHGMSESDSFADWAAGLPAVLDTCYFYNRSAVDDLAGILEETDAEKARYNESDAEQLLTRLIYHELLKGSSEH